MDQWASKKKTDPKTMTNSDYIKFNKQFTTAFVRNFYSCLCSSSFSVKV